jgi:hypothetical protein
MTTKPIILIFIFSILISCKNKINEPPYDLYWKTINDSLSYSRTNLKNNSITLDTNSQFKVIYGHFTSKTKEECLLQRSFIRFGGDKFTAACLFSIENNKWICRRFLCKDSIWLMDVDKDNINEIFYYEDEFGFGSVERVYLLISYKNNIFKTLFEDSNNYNDTNNMGAFSISKIGDTLYNWSTYSFFKNANELMVRKTKIIGIKKGINVDSTKLFIKYSKSENTFNFIPKK